MIHDPQSAHLPQSEWPSFKVIARNIIAVLVPMLIFSACINNYGRFAIDKSVDRDFQNGVIRSEYQYFYAGRDTMPYAIIGIDRTYSVSSRQWVPFDPQPGQLRKMSGNIYDQGQNSPYGAYIKTPDGEIIGIWYSNIFIRSVQVAPPKGNITLLFVNPENHDQPE